MPAPDNLAGLVDTHCHLQEYSDVASILERARENNVVHVICQSVDLGSAYNAVNLSHEHPQQVSAAVGFHPQTDTLPAKEQLDEIKKLAKTSVVVAIGEIGLDALSPERGGIGIDSQSKLLRAQIEIAKTLDLPICVHCRQAFDELFSILSEFRPVKGVMHCFTGDSEWAKRFVGIGMYISFSGNLTYPKNSYLREAALSVPKDRLLIETDAPYLSPQRYRGMRNEPSLLVETLEALSAVLGVEQGTLTGQLHANTVALFPKIALRLRSA
jgi:TatD DNase family protein